MSRLRLSLMGRLAVTMATITIAAVALSMTLVYHSLDGRLNRLGAAHVESSAARVAAIAASHYNRGWSPSSSSAPTRPASTSPSPISRAAR
jgi:hypothetical protein